MKCPKCKSENTSFYGTEGGDSIYKCNDCDEKFYPHMEFLSSISGYGKLCKCPKCGHEFYPENQFIISGEYPIPNIEFLHKQRDVKGE